MEEQLLRWLLFSLVAWSLIGTYINGTCDVETQSARAPFRDITINSNLNCLTLQVILGEGNIKLVDIVFGALFLDTGCYNGMIYRTIVLSTLSLSWKCKNGTMKSNQNHKFGEVRDSWSWTLSLYISRSNQTFLVQKCTVLFCPKMYSTKRCHVKSYGLKTEMAVHNKRPFCSEDFFQCSLDRLLFPISLRELGQLIICNLSCIWLQATKGNLSDFSWKKINAKYEKLQSDAERLITQSVMWLWLHYVIPTRRSHVRLVHTHPKAKFTFIFEPWFLVYLQSILLSLFDQLTNTLLCILSRVPHGHLRCQIEQFDRRRQIDKFEIMYKREIN